MSVLVVAVAGASGFIGGAVSKEFVRRSIEVQHVGRADSRLPEAPTGARRILVNCAGIADARSNDPAALSAANVDFPLRLAEMAIESEVAHFVHLSSAKVYEGRGGLSSASSGPSPLSAYARSKLEADDALVEKCRTAQMTLTIVRPPPVWGKHSGRTALLERWVAAGVPIPVVDPPARRSFVSIDSLALRISGLVAETGCGSSIVVPVDPNPSSTEELARELSTRPVRQIRVNHRVLKTLAAATGVDLAPFYRDEELIDSRALL